MRDHLDRKSQRLNEFRELCRSRGIPLTWQRQAVLTALLERDDHPTADQIYESLGTRHPGLSRTTVYRVLDTLVDLDVVARANHPGAAARFDAMTERHHHLLCTSCGRLEDVPDTDIRAVEVEVNLPEGYEPHDYSIYFRGLCAACAGGTLANHSKKEETSS